MSWCSLAALIAASALFCSGCDSSGSYSNPAEALPRGDPDEIGSDEDVGAEDLEPTPVELHGRLRVDGTQLVDEASEPVQLKGVSSMWLNWESDGYAESLPALRWMRNNWRLSVIRAAMGVEPEGAYLSDPKRALEQVYTIVDNAIEAGVYVIVDWHDHSAHERESDAVAFFSRVAEDFSGVPNVIYEPFNEPVGVNWPELKRYHESVVAAIREHDEEALIVLGTPSYSQEVDEAASDPVEGSNLLYTLHYYSCTHGGNLRLKGDVALSRGVALFVTEFGATHADGGLDGNLCLDAAQQWDDWLRAHRISWTAWKLDNCTPDSTCLLSWDAPLEGGWTSQYLHGHALFVRGRMQQ
jgi:endoglucanase